MASKASKKPSEAEIEEKRRQRAEKKQREVEKKELAEKDGLDLAAPTLFAARRWSKVRAEGSRSINGSRGNREEAQVKMEGKTVRILSWNILAQGLVRRKLFPGSDCLKWKEREAGLSAELRAHDWDIAAFQEVDKIEVHGPKLEESGRRYLYAKGYASKQHGLMIAWRVPSHRQNAQPLSRMTFRDEAVASKIVYFDHEIIGSTSIRRTGLSRVTRNIALFAALASSTNEREGIIVATTHLFWHPMHAYERVRQTGILKRKLLAWKQENAIWKDWPVILVGDFNDQAHSATYKLMVGEPLTLHNWQEVADSSVVHQSVDEARRKKESDEELAKAPNGHGIAETSADADEDDEEANEEEDDDGEGNDDQMLKNCRRALPIDGILSFAELIQLHDLSLPIPEKGTATSSSDGKELVGHQIEEGAVSAYGSYFDSLEEDQEGNYFGSIGRGRERFDDLHWTPETPNPHLGDCKEPMYTLHSTIFALTLDYIFLFPPHSAVSALLPTHRTEVLAPGIPRKGVCASDHIAIGAEIQMP